MRFRGCDAAHCRARPARTIGDIGQALAPFLIDIEHARRGFEELRKPRRVVADVVDESEHSATMRERKRSRYQVVCIGRPVEPAPAVDAGHAVFAGDRIPLLAVIGRLDQRIGEIAQADVRRRSVRNSTARTDCAAMARSEPIVDVVAHQARLHFPEVAVGAAGEQRQGSERENAPAPIGPAHRRLQRNVHRVVRQWLRFSARCGGDGAGRNCCRCPAQGRSTRPGSARYGSPEG